MAEINLESALEFTEGLIGPTDFLLKDCKIINATGTPTEFRFVNCELNYYEDIFGNACSGNIIISDSSNYQNDGSFCGDEFLKLQLYKPGNDTGSIPLKKYCRIYKMNNRNLTKDSNENYLLNFSTEEIFVSEQRRVSKAYNTTISNIVIDIAKNYLGITDEDLGLTRNSDGTSFYANVIETLGNYHIIVPNLKPMEAINWLATLAICKDTRIKGASYLFFQNKNGWNFKPLVAIYGDYERYGQYYDKYWYGVKNDGETEIFDPTGWDVKNILSYQIMDNYDTFESTQDGMFANRLLWNDNFKRLHEETKFDYVEYFKSLKELSLYKNWQPYGLMSDAENRFNEKHNEVHDTVLKMGFKTQNNRVDVTIPHRFAQLRIISGNRLKIAVPGDTNLTIGLIIYIELKCPAPVQQSNTEPSKKTDKFYSGRYLITALHHRIDQEQNFETILELCKDSFTSSVSTMDEPGLKPFNNGSQELIEARRKGTF